MSGKYKYEITCKEKHGIADKLNLALSSTSTIVANYTEAILRKRVNAKQRTGSSDQDEYKSR